MSARSQDAYRRGWEAFESYCAERGLDPMAAIERVIADWAALLASKGAARRTISARLYGVFHHREKAARPVNQGAQCLDEFLLRLHNAPLTRPRPDARQIRLVLVNLGDDPESVVARGLILVPAYTNARVAALQKITSDDFDARSGSGRAAELRVEGRAVVLPRQSDRRFCPVAAIEEILALNASLGAHGGPLFRLVTRSPIGEAPIDQRQIQRVLKRAAERVGAAAPTIESVRAVAQKIFETQRQRGEKFALLESKA